MPVTIVEAYIAMYLPTILSTLTTLINFIGTYSKFKQLDYKTPINKCVNLVDNKIDKCLIKFNEMKEYNKKLIDENAQLIKDNAELKQFLEKQLLEQKQMISDILNKNCELNAQIREKK